MEHSVFITKCQVTSKYPMGARASGETFLHYNTWRSSRVGCVFLCVAVADCIENN